MSIGIWEIREGAPSYIVNGSRHGWVTETAEGFTAVIPSLKNPSREFADLETAKVWIEQEYDRVMDGLRSYMNRQRQAWISERPIKKGMPDAVDTNPVNRDRNWWDKLSSKS